MPRDFNLNYYEADSILEETIRSLKKDTKKIISNNADYWYKIKQSNISEVYSFGFSYSEVDLPYIITIVKNLDNSGLDVVWRLNSFDDSNGKNDIYERRLRECGFAGEIERFN